MTARVAHKAARARQFLKSSKGVLASGGAFHRLQGMLFDRKA